jgi:hypothetical protein
MKRVTIVDKKHTFYVKNFFFEVCVVYEVIWKNVVEPDRPHMTLYGACALHAAWLRLQIHTHNISFPRQQLLGESSSYIACLVCGSVFRVTRRCRSVRDNSHNAEVPLRQQLLWCYNICVLRAEIIALAMNEWLWNISGIILRGENRSSQGNPALVLLCPSKFLRVSFWDRTRAYAMTSD